MKRTKPGIQIKEIELGEQRKNVEAGYNWFKWCDLIPYISFGGDLGFRYYLRFGKRW